MAKQLALLHGSNAVDPVLISAMRVDRARCGVTSALLLAGPLWSCSGNASGTRSETGGRTGGADAEADALVTCGSGAACLTDVHGSGGAGNVDSAFAPDVVNDTNASR